MTTTAQNEYIESLDGELTPEQVARLLELGEGDTGASAQEDDGVPAAITGKGEATEGDASETVKNTDAAPAASTTQAPANVELTADNAVLMAKDGKHTIGYEKLVEARRGEQQWREQAEATQRKLDELTLQAQARVDAGVAPTKTDNQVAVAEAAIAQGVDPGIFGDFSEEALASGIGRLVAEQVADLKAQFASTVQQALAPYQQKQAAAETEGHLSAIYTAHPDADSIAESKELADWIAAQPSYARPGIQRVFTEGTTQDVIEVFDRFKQATGATQAKAPAPADVKAKAQAAIAQAAPAVPASLSDFPGGRAGPGSRDEALADMDGLQLLEAMDTMTPEQIAYYLNKL